MMVGGFSFYLICGVAYVILFPGPVTNSYECTRGNFLGWLSIFLGVASGAGLGGYVGYRLLDDDPAETVVNRTNGS